MGERLRGHRHADAPLGERRPAVLPLLAGRGRQPLPRLRGTSQGAAGVAGGVQLWAGRPGQTPGPRPWTPQEVCPALRSADPAGSRAAGTLPEMAWFPFLNSVNPNSARKHPRKDLAGACFQEAALLTLVLRGQPAPRLPLLPGPCVCSAHSAF